MPTTLKRYRKLFVSHPKPPPWNERDMAMISNCVLACVQTATTAARAAGEGFPYVLMRMDGYSDPDGPQYKVLCTFEVAPQLPADRLADYVAALEGVASAAAALPDHSNSLVTATWERPT